MTEEIEYRGYVFVNSALSSIQKGVQGAHAMVEVTNKYPVETNDAASALIDWRENYKTLIFLEAGFHQGILENYLTFAHYCEKLNLPHALFVEDDETMNSMATAFAGVIPSDVYDFDLMEFDHMRTVAVRGLDDIINAPEEPDAVALCRFLKGFHLAR